jgi:hypothetical protein
MMKQRVVGFAVIVLGVFVLSQFARADELALSCVPSDSRPGTVSFNAWIDLQSSHVLMVWTSGYDRALRESSAVITATSIRWSVYDGGPAISIDRQSGQATDYWGGDTWNLGCSRSSAPKPAMKF